MAVQQAPVPRYGHLVLAATIDAFKRARQLLDPAQWREGDGVAAENLSLVAKPALDALRSGRIPLPRLVVQPDTRGMGGVFHPGDWTIRASQDSYGKPRAQITADWMREKAADLYHECRHVEQYWLAARLVVASADERSNAEKEFLGLVLRSVLLEAAGRGAPVNQASHAAIAQWVRESGRVYDVAVERDAAREAILELGRRLEGDRASLPDPFDPVTCDLQPDILEARTRSGAALLDRYQRAFAAYVALSAERDAYAAGAEAGGQPLPDAQQVARSLYDGHVGAALIELDAITEVRSRGCAPRGPLPDIPADEADEVDEDDVLDEPVPPLPAGAVDTDSDDEST